MSQIRHRVIVDLTAEEIDSFVVRQRLAALGEVHTVSVKKMADEHVCVQRLAAGLGRNDLELKYSQLTELMRSLQNSELTVELDDLATRLGAQNSSGKFFP